MGKTQHRLTGPMSRRLRQAREDAGLSRPQLAELTGVSERCIAYYEDPTYSSARKAVNVRPWAEACGRTFEEIWGTPGRPLDRFGCTRGTELVGAA